MKSWKTTIAGIVCIIGGVVLLAIEANAENAAMATTFIFAGLELIGARDRNVSSEGEGLKQHGDHL